MKKIKYFAILSVFSLICTAIPALPAKAEGSQLPNSSTETIIEHNLSSGTTNSFDLTLDYTQTDTRDYINTASPFFLEPLDDPEENPPFNGIGYLRIEHEGGNTSHGTAFLVGKNLALTAAHCVEDGELGNTTYMCLYVGQNGDGNRIASSQASSYYVSTFWDPNTSGSNEYDWALIKLSTSMDLSKVSILPCEVRSMAGKTIMVSGYASEDGTYDDFQNITEGTVLSDDGWLLSTTAEGREGISGSPMFDMDNYDGTVVGISSGMNILNHISGPKINTTMVNLINNFNSRN